MINKIALLTGLIGVVVFLTFYGVYALASGWDIPLWVAVAVATAVFLAVTILSHFFLAQVASASTSQDI